MVKNQRVGVLASAARSCKPVAGLTHNFYRYPARFSPEFAAAAIHLFSKPCDVVYDPYMGGGTAIVEATASGRRAMGSDVNSLAVFVTKVKTTRLRLVEREAIRHWGEQTIASLKYNEPRCAPPSVHQGAYTYNLGLYRARFIKKIVALALDSLESLPSQNSRDFARCALPKTAQWALDGRRAHTSVTLFRQRLTLHLAHMLDALTEDTL